jgi:hypothetical protein
MVNYFTAHGNLGSAPVAAIATAGAVFWAPRHDLAPKDWTVTIHWRQRSGPELGLMYV